MLRWLGVGIACALGLAWACGGTINGGGGDCQSKCTLSDECERVCDGGSPEGEAREVGTRDGGAACSSPCVAPQVCIALPGASTAFCGAACSSDNDCPALLTCQGGLCSATCSTCGAGEECVPVLGQGFDQCKSNTDCPIGSYCVGETDEETSVIPMCIQYSACSECTGSCPTCTSNSQCEAGQVCLGGRCQTCTSDSQCGPSARCSATHTSLQCTCSRDGDCAAGGHCQMGICTPNPPDICDSSDAGCATDQGCVAGVCGECTTFTDCAIASKYSQRGVMPGLTCVDGVCTHCTANSQCGGGQACVGGTCGTCITNAQCGPEGSCMDGFCTCTSSAQCAAGQRCGAGVCVAM